LILINFLWELFTDGIEHIFWKKNRHIVIMLEKLYKELTIVALWSVALFVLTSTFGVNDPTLKHVFELIHISLFGLVLIYIGVVIFMALLSLVIFKQFHRLEELDEDQVKENFLSDLAAKSDKFFLTYYLNPYSLIRRYLNKVCHNYYTYRSCFIHQLNLVETFHFDAYLKRAMKATFTEWAQIHWSVLALVLVAQLAIWMAFSTFIHHNNGIPYIILASLCFLCFLVLHLKIDMIYTTLRDMPQIWGEPEKSRYEEAEEAKEAGDLDSEIDGDMGSYEIEMASYQDSSEDPYNVAHKDSEFHVRVHASSSESESDSAQHRNKRKQQNYHRRASKPAFAHYSSSSDSPNSTASWVSTWSSSSSWESVVEIADEDGTGINRRRHHHHHHHHHHHQTHHTKHQHQSDLSCISGCLIPLICCRIHPSDIRNYFAPSQHEKIFWFGSPGFFLYLCHLSTFWQATVIALIIGSLFGFLEVYFVYKIFAILLSCINLCYFIPFIVYHYSFCMNVGEFSRHEFIREVYEKPNRKSRQTKVKREAEMDSDSDMSEEYNRSSSSPRSVIVMNELRKNQEQNLKKILPPHPRIRKLAGLEREDSLATLVATPPMSSSSSSE